MSNRPSRPPAYPAFIGKDRELLRLVARVNELNRLQAAVRAALPVELAPACQSVSWAGSELLIGVTSSAAAARIRLSAPRMLEKLVEAGWQITGITPRVQVALQVEKSRKTKDLHLSDAAFSALGELAETVDDAGLEQALRNLLASHAERILKRE